jgi:hypothetical protein
MKLKIVNHDENQGDPSVTWIQFIGPNYSIHYYRGIATDSGKISYAFFNLDRSLSWYF